MSDFDYDTYGGGVEMFGTVLDIPNREIYGVVHKDSLPKNGSPQDRGSADRYYGRSYNPHFWPQGTEKGYKVTESQMTQSEIQAYKYGFDNEEDRKNWG